MILPTPKHVCISRVDNIGDVVLTLGLATRLKLHFPDVRITFLARDYVRDVVALCPAVDTFLSADHCLSQPNHVAIQQLRTLEIDTFIHAFPRRRLAWLAYRAGIPTRIGTARRWYHRITCNLRPNFSRAQSTLHEAELNLRLLEPFGLSALTDPASVQDLLRLYPSPASLSTHLVADKFNLIVHPFTNGNTREWPLTHFSELIGRLPPDRFHVCVTGSPQEHARLAPLLHAHPSVTDLSGKLSLQEFSTLVAQADGLIANSTGPLHLAAALGIRTLGLFPQEHSMGPQRWRPIGPQAEYLASPEIMCPPTPCSNHDCRCIRAVSVDAVYQRLTEWAAA